MLRNAYKSQYKLLDAKQNFTTANKIQGCDGAG